MSGGDLLGDEGRKWVNSCVKVGIFAEPCEYTRDEALERVHGCYANPMVFEGLLPPKMTYNIVDIFKAVSDLDRNSGDMGCVVYPKEECDSEEVLHNILNQRKEIEREYQRTLPFCDQKETHPKEGVRTNKVSQEKEHVSTFSDADEQKDFLLVTVPVESMDSISNQGDEDPIGAMDGISDQQGENPVGAMDSISDQQGGDLIGAMDSTSDPWDDLHTGAIDSISDQHKSTQHHPTEQVHLFGPAQDFKSRRGALPQTTSCEEIDHGSGFIISDHLIITNWHVVRDVKDEKIYIYNEVIDKARCEVIDHDLVSDLVLLYCEDLCLEQNGVYPLPLSVQAPLQGEAVFIFGYPFTYAGRKALFVSGYVSGSVERYARSPLPTLYCSVCPGNSGGPVFSWIKGQLKVVAVLSQRHKKNILSIEEKNIIEGIRGSLPGTSSITDNLKDHSASPEAEQTALISLTLKLYDAVEETHCQFGLCNAVPGSLVVEFVGKAFAKCEGQLKKELADVVKLSADHKNVLPSGYRSVSECCIQ